MRVFALELDNDIKGVEERKAYIEGLVSRLPAPDLVVLPELALCSYMASQRIWQYADEGGRDASAWAVGLAGEPSVPAVRPETGHGGGDQGV